MRSFLESAWRNIASGLAWSASLASLASLPVAAIAQTGSLMTCSINGDIFNTAFDSVTQGFLLNGARCELG